MVTSFNLGDHLAPGEKASEQTSEPTTLVYCCCFNPAIRFYNPYVVGYISICSYYAYEHGRLKRGKSAQCVQIQALSLFEGLPIDDSNNNHVARVANVKNHKF